MAVKPRGTSHREPGALSGQKAATMATTLKRGSDFMGDRYRYDFRDCTLSKGWAQLDTKQDASYFGNWINPTKRKLFSYCEGDTTLTECDTDEDFVTAVRECCEWHKERGYFIGIDAGGVSEIEAGFDRLGLGEYLHGRATAA